MRFEVKREWLERRLAVGDDAEVMAGVADLDKLKREVAALSVTPGSLEGSATQFGRVIRFIREKKGWSISDLARKADIDEEELNKLEHEPGFQVEPRTVIQLASNLHLSKDKLLVVSGLVKPRGEAANSVSNLKFAANSNGLHNITADELDVIRALVEYLSES